MNKDNQHDKVTPRSPWQTPEITTLSISRDTEQLDPPPVGTQS